ncbi:MAG: hypothetical protein ACM3JB_06190 [Acidobacteriaceae bacterium]
MPRGIAFGLVLLLIAAAPAYSQAPQNGSVAPPAPGRGQSSNKQTTTPSGSKNSESSKPAPKSSLRHWRTYCSEEAEYCISYPPDWDVVGDVMEGNGIVMAPPQNGKNKALWNDITVSVTDLPETEEGKPSPSFDDIVSVALSGLPGKNVETLQRSQLTLHERDAELIKVSYNDKETNQPWVEEIIFIDDELAIYSIALRSTPDDVATLEETFRRVVASWRPSEPEAPATAPAKPKSPATKAPVQK